MSRMMLDYPVQYEDSDEAAFNDFVVAKAEIFVDPSILPEVRAEMRDDHRIVFTHSDLAPRNILVKDGKGPVENLYLGETETPAPGPGKVLVKVRT